MHWVVSSQIFSLGVKYRLQTDAPNLGISVILYQCDLEGNHYFISSVDA